MTAVQNIEKPGGEPLLLRKPLDTTWLWSYWEWGRWQTSDLACRQQPRGRKQL